MPACVIALLWKKLQSYKNFLNNIITFSLLSVAQSKYKSLAAIAVSILTGSSLVDKLSFHPNRISWLKQ